MEKQLTITGYGFGFLDHIPDGWAQIFYGVFMADGCMTASIQQRAGRLPWVRLEAKIGLRDDDTPFLEFVEKMLGGSITKRKGYKNDKPQTTWRITNPSKLFWTFVPLMEKGRLPMSPIIRPKKDLELSIFAKLVDIQYHTNVPLALTSKWGRVQELVTELGRLKTYNGNGHE